MTWNRVEKLYGVDNLQRLRESHVGVVGIGSGGGFVALSLAMSGVGHFTLIDDDIIEEVNITRHVADRRYIGQNKAAAVADLILQRNPQAVVKVIEGRIEHHMEALDGIDLLVVGVDGENAKYLINEACLKRRVTAVYAGVYERGEGGDVVIIRPYDGPCYACWSAEVRGNAAVRVDPNTQQLDYGMIGAKGTLEAEPGLWIHVVKVASVQTDIVLNELLRGTSVHEEMPGNTVVMANNYIEIVDGDISAPHTGLWFNVERDPQCLVCGDKARLAIESHQSLSLDALADLTDGLLEEQSDENAS